MKPKVAGPAATDGGAAAAMTPAEWDPAVDARLTRAGTWMLLVADLFFFAAFFFAYFYLRSMNNDASWMPSGTDHPPRGGGAVIVALVVISAAAYWAAARDMGPMRLLLWIGLAAGVIGVGVQVYEFGHLGFDPQQGGGYPSVFIGLKGAITFEFAAALLWMATHISQARPMGDFMARRTTAVTFGNFLFFLAGISLLAYLVLYFL